MSRYVNFAGRRVKANITFAIRRAAREKARSGSKLEFVLDNNATNDSELGQIWFRLKKNFPKRNKIQNSGRQLVNQEN